MFILMDLRTLHIAQDFRLQEERDSRAETKTMTHKARWRIHFQMLIPDSDHTIQLSLE